MFFILTMIVLVAVFNIISSLIMLVKDKSKAIAILRTMGISKGSVVRVFVSGSCIGVMLGAAIALHIDSIKNGLENLTGTTLFDPVVYFLSQLPSEVFDLSKETLNKMTLFIKIFIIFSGIV